MIKIQVPEKYPVVFRDYVIPEGLETSAVAASAIRAGARAVFFGGGIKKNTSKSMIELSNFQVFKMFFFFFLNSITCKVAFRFISANTEKLKKQFE